MLKRIKDFLNRRGKKPGPGDPFSESAPPGESSDPELVGGRPPVQIGPRVVHRPIPQSDLDPDAVKIVQRLTRFDHSAYLVGGCVRDLLLDKRPKDFDIGTSATPRQIKRLFRNSRIIGRRFRLAHVYFHNGKIIEVATFRATEGDGEESDGGGDRDLMIRDDNRFGTPEEDALRRDFTVNALFYDVNQETVLDHAGGLGDLRRRVIRTIGDPEVRFREDPIRILRAIKFAARLDFEIEPATLEALQGTRNEIPRAAAPRILEEINRFCRGGAARRSFELLREHGILRVIMPTIADAYDERPESWDLLAPLLDRIDEGHRQGKEVATGAILAVLLLPLLIEKFGWSTDGRAEPPRGLDVRAEAEAWLRPPAELLRIARKDQEHCRQILLALFRMIPHARVRRQTRRSILQRDCFPDVLWILDVVASRFGGEFRAAHDSWSRAEATRPESDGAPDEQGSRRRSGRRKRGGRGRGRGASRDEQPAAPRDRSRGGRQSPGAASGGKKESDGQREPAKRSGPSKWDDDYFFAALPSVPGLPEGEDDASHYGGTVITRASGEQETAPAETRDETPDGNKDDRPATRKRRRRRPRRGRQGGAQRAASSQGNKKEGGEESGGNPESGSGSGSDSN